MNHLNDHHRVLLIDQNRTKQTLRANILRNFEIEVHTASNVTDAAGLCRTHLYDLVLLAAQENSDEAAIVSAQIRKIYPRQRIGLLVGPPVFVLELPGVRTARKKAASVRGVAPSRVVDDLSLPASVSHDAAPYASSPQWQEMIRRMVTDWYVDSSALFGSLKVTDQITGA